MSTQIEQYSGQVVFLRSSLRRSMIISVKFIFCTFGFVSLFKFFKMFSTTLLNNLGEMVFPCQTQLCTFIESVLSQVIVATYIQQPIYFARLKVNILTRAVLGYLIHKNTQNISDITSNSSNKIDIILKFNNRYSLKVFLTYAPTSIQSEQKNRRMH